MAHAHVQPGDDEPPASERARRLLTALLVPLGLLTLVGLVVLWPGEIPDLSDELGASDDLVDGRVVDVEHGPCPNTPAEVEVRCASLLIEILGGPDAGTNIELSEPLAPQTPTFEAGDTIVLSYLAGAEPEHQYAFADFERRTPLFILGALFVVAVLLLGRLQGLMALLGLVISLGILVGFILPAVLDGQNPLAVALVGSAAIAFVSLYLAHGLNARTTTALLGSLCSLALVGVLGAVFVAASRFTGLADESAQFLNIASGEIDPRGLLLGGLVIGALGVLDDVTITQASAVWELHRANPRYGRLELYRSAIRIGRDHIASTVNTLVLAYAGASLPLFLLLFQADVGFIDAATGETMAVEVVRTLCGSIGLVAAVPLTTGLAALVAVGRSPADDRPRWAGGPGADPASEEAGPAAGDDDRDDSGDGRPARPAPRPRPTRSTDPKRFRGRGERKFWDE